MFLLLFILIQSQQPRLSPFVIAGAVLAFIIGIALLVYFFRRFKASEKEAEEDWSLSRRSLFVSPEPAVQKAEEVAAAQPTRPERIDPAPIDAEPINAEPINAEPINAAPINRAATEALGSIRTGEIHEVTDEQAARHPRPTEALKAESLPAIDMSPAEAPVREERPTQVLSSIQPEDSVKEAQAVDEVTPFDNEVLAGLDLERQQAAQPAPPAAAPDRGTQFFGSDQPWPAIEQDSFEKVNEPRIQPPVEQVEPGREARIGSSTRLEQFEPPRIERMSQREQFEPPVIKPLTPREQSTFIETQRDSSPSQDLYGEPSGYGAKVERKPPERERPPAAQSSYEDAARRPEPVAPPTIYPAPADRPAEPYLAARQVAPASGGKSRAGSILGLPAEASQGPLILGEPVRSKEERGIDALSHYGKPLEKDGGRGGTIALLAVILILGGGFVAYFFIPSIHAGINGWVARVRGTDVEEARRAAMIPKAVIYPRFNSEVNKNQIKIKGAVDNIWNEPLENLTVEVTLVRGADASPQIIPVAVSPNPLPPNQRGTFDFEYDGKRDTGFSGYKITKLLSNGNEVRFTSPNTQK